jgi:Glyoxalase-like domain
MLSLSQLIFGVNDLEAATLRFRAMGFDVLDGGVHPGVGTANRVIPLRTQYIELLGVVAPDLARESEYGRSLLAAIADGDRLVRWSLRTDAIEEVAARLGLTVEPRKRARPDGVLLTWRAAGLSLALADSTTPFFMQWDRDEHYPGLMPAKHANGARAVTKLSIAPRDAGLLRRWTEGADAPLHLLADHSPGLVSIDVQTDVGVLTLRG